MGDKQAAPAGREFGPCGKHRAEIDVHYKELEYVAQSSQPAPAGAAFDDWWTSSQFEFGESSKSIAYRAWSAALRSTSPAPMQWDHELDLYPHNPNTGRYCLKCTQEAAASPVAEGEK